MQNTGKEIYKIGSAQQLREELNLGADVEVPEIKQAIEFTREEWMQLKNEISNKDGLGITEIIKGKLERKLRKSTEVQGESVRAITEMKADALRKNVGEGTDLSRIQSGQGREIPSVNNAQQQNTLEAAKSAVQSSPSLMEKPWEWAKEHPFLAIGAGIGTVLVGSWIFGGESNKSSGDKKDEGGEEQGWFKKCLEICGIKGDTANTFSRYGFLLGALVIGAGLFLGKDKIGEFFGEAIDKVKDFFGWESKEMKAAYESFAKTISVSGDKVEVKPETLSKLKKTKVNDFISTESQIGSALRGWVAKVGNNFETTAGVLKTLGLSDENEIKQTQAIQKYLTQQIKDKKLIVSPNTTIEDLVKKFSGNFELMQEADKDSSHKINIGPVAAAVAGGAAITTAEVLKTGEELPGQPKDSNKLPGMNLLNGSDATGKDRLLGSRVTEYFAKMKYYDMVYRSYVKYKGGTDIGAHRIHVLDSMNEYSHELGSARGTFAVILEAEKKGGLQGLLARLSSAKSKVEVDLIKQEIDLFLKNSAKFEKEFELYVRNAKLEKNIFNATTYETNPNIQRFEALKQGEAQLAKDIHEVSSQFDKDILALRTRAKNENWSATMLSSEESKIRKAFSEALHGETGVITRLRNTQNQMMAELRTISKTQSHHTSTYMKSLELNGTIKPKTLGGGKLGWALIGITAGSIVLTGLEDKEKMMYMGAEAIGAFIPFVNVGLDFKQIMTGRDLAGGNLAGWERWGMAPAFLILDSIASMASATGVGYAFQAGLASTKVAIKGGELAKTAVKAKGAIKVAEAGHAFEGTTKELGILEKLKQLGIEGGLSAREITRIPSDFLKKYAEGMQVAKGSGVLRMAGPLASACKIAVYGGIGYSIYTGIGEYGTVVTDKIASIPESLNLKKAA